jgi:uncharacterized protein with HEPN domain
MNERDKVRLLHMRDAAKAGSEFVQGRTITDLETDLMFSYAVQYALQIVGEAAAQVTIETRLQYPQIDWKNIIGMRQWLVHGYNRLQFEVVWATATRDLTALIAQIEAILVIPPLNPSNPDT